MYIETINHKNYERYIAEEYCDKFGANITDFYINGYEPQFIVAPCDDEDPYIRVCCFDTNNTAEPGSAEPWHWYKVGVKQVVEVLLDPDVCDF